MTHEILRDEALGDQPSSLNRSLDKILSKHDPDFVQNLLTESIQSWLQNEPTRHRPRWDLVSRVQTVFENEGPIRAVVVLAENSREMAVSDSDKRTVKGLGRKVEAVLTGKTEVPKGRSSSVLTMGGAAHKIMEELVTADNWKKVFCDKYDLIVVHDQVVGFVEKSPSQSYVQSSFDGTDLNTQNAEAPRQIMLEHSLDSPAEGQDLHDWAITSLDRYLTELIAESGQLPGKPYDISQIVKDDKSRACLMKILGIMQYVYCSDGKSGMNLVEWNGNSGELNARMATEFKTLNWLTIVRKLHERASSNNRYTPGLVELPVGEMRVSRTNGDQILPEAAEKVSAKKIDLLRVSWKDPENHENELDLEAAVELIKGRFNSQAARYRRSDEVGNSKEVSTLNLRNVRTLFKELYKIYGDSIFTDLVMQIDDFKFPGGDGGWFTQFNEANLPLNEHREQVSKYLFRVAAQLHWVQNWAKQDSIDQVEIATDENGASDFRKVFNKDTEKIPINVESVADFILRTGLRERMVGVLRYQTPAKEQLRLVSLADNRNELLVEGYAAFKRNSEEVTNDKKVLRALAQVLGGKISELIPVEKEKPKLPEQLKEFCIQTEGGNFLCVDLLSRLIDDRLIETKQAALRNGVIFSERNGEKQKVTEVVWIDNLLEGINLRIAVDKRGGFTIASTGDPNNSFVVHGRLLSTIYQQGVLELSSDLVEAYDKNVFRKLPFGPATVQIGFAEGVVLQSPVGGESIVTPEGEVRRRVRGKPSVTLWDPMGSGKWYLDPMRLKEYLESDAGKRDHWGLNKIGELVADKTKRNIPVMCPRDDHDNRKTPAAHWYGADDAPHILCRADCDCSFSLDKIFERKIDINSVHVAPGFDVEDYRSVSEGRHKVISSFLYMSEMFVRVTEVANNYIGDVRGLDPQIDLGPYGFLPYVFTDSLQRLVNSGSFRAMKKEKRDFRLDQLENIAQHYGLAEDFEFQTGLVNISELLCNSFSEDEREVVWEQLRLSKISEMQRRGLIKKTNQLGGRIILPTYWVCKTDVFGENLPVAMSNINARGIRLNGQELFEGEPHIKARLSRGTKTVQRELDDRSVEVRLLDTPAGFWCRDWAKFFQEVARLKSVIIFEGPLSSASFSRISRIEGMGLEDICLTNIGTGYKEMYAFLKFLGVKNFERSSESLRLGVENIILAFDFDKTGSEKTAKRSNELKGMFPNASVATVLDILPRQLRGVFPTYNPVLYGEDGVLEGIKIDFNDYLNSAGFQMNAKNAYVHKLIEKAVEHRNKYAYIP